MPQRFFKFILIASLCFVTAGCSSTKSLFLTEFSAKEESVIVPEEVRKHYSAMTDGKYTLPAVNVATIEPKYWRRIVIYPTLYPVGTIVINTKQRFLYLIQPNDKAIRYGVGVGKSGLAFSGNAIIGAKLSWPHWSPTKDMMARSPELYGNMEKGMGPGVDNPLGSRAMYLYRDGKDTHFRIHGSHEEWSIGKAMSSGCIRMLNQDVIDLFRRVKVGTKVVVISEDNIRHITDIENKYKKDNNLF